MCLLRVAQGLVYTNPKMNEYNCLDIGIYADHNRNKAQSSHC